MRWWSPHYILVYWPLWRFSLQFADYFTHAEVSKLSMVKTSFISFASHQDPGLSHHYHFDAFNTSLKSDSQFSMYGSQFGCKSFWPKQSKLLNSILTAQPANAPFLSPPLLRTVTFFTWCPTWDTLTSSNHPANSIRSFRLSTSVVCVTVLHSRYQAFTRSDFEVTRSREDTCFPRTAILNDRACVTPVLSMRRYWYAQNTEINTSILFLLPRVPTKVVRYEKVAVIAGCGCNVRISIKI